MSSDLQFPLICSVLSSLICSVLSSAASYHLQFPFICSFLSSAVSFHLQSALSSCPLICSVLVFSVVASILSLPLLFSSLGSELTLMSMAPDRSETFLIMRNLLRKIETSVPTLIVLFLTKPITNNSRKAGPTIGCYHASKYGAYI